LPDERTVTFGAVSWVVLRLSVPPAPPGELGDRAVDAEGVSEGDGDRSRVGEDEQSLAGGSVGIGGLALDPVAVVTDRGNDTTDPGDRHSHEGREVAGALDLSDGRRSGGRDDGVGGGCLCRRGGEDQGGHDENGCDNCCAYSRAEGRHVYLFTERNTARTAAFLRLWRPALKAQPPVVSFERIFG